MTAGPTGEKPQGEDDGRTRTVEGTPAPKPALPPQDVASGQEESILTALGDPVSRRVLSRTNSTPVSAQELLGTIGVPQSTLYRKLHELRGARLLAIQRTVVTPDGRRVDLFRSLLREAEVRFHEGGVKVRAQMRELSSERLADLWTDVREGGKR